MHAGERAIGVGIYVRPDDSTEDPGHIHKHEGMVWATEDLPEPTTGEKVAWAHVAKNLHGRLDFQMVRFDRVGAAYPAGPGDVDSLLRIAGKVLAKEGRKVDRRVIALVHACGFVLGLPQIVRDVPSVFGDEPEITAEDVTSPGIVVDHDTQVARLLDRLGRLDTTAVNEIRRDARHRQLAYLETGSPMTLGDLVAYDALLARWERAAARQTQAAS